jgi:hypothetical protein
MSAIDAWWAAHPHLVELALFCLSVFVAIFPERSRKWVLTPFAYSAMGMLRIMQRDAANQLKVVHLIDGSAFKLVAYIGFYCINSALWCGWTSAIFWICINLISYWQTGHMSFIPFSLLLFGGFTGRAMRLYYMLGGLLHLEEYVKRLENMAAGKRID